MNTIYKFAASLADDKVVPFIEDYFKRLFDFKPGWSDFGEIICEYLTDDFYCNEDYISMRYELSVGEAQSVLAQLKLFAAERPEQDV